MVKKTLSKLLPLDKITKKMKFLMKPKNTTKVLILLSILLVLFLVHKHYISKEGLVMKAQSFEDEISATQGKCLVLFHASWCGHCKKLMPEWDSVSKEINAESENMKLVKVECGSPDKEESHKRIGK